MEGDPRSPAAIRARLKQTKAEATPPATPPATPKPEPKKQPRPIPPDAVYDCGHALKKLSGNCPECRERNRQKKAAAKRAKRQAAGKPLGRDKKPIEVSGRLPQGAQFVVTYDADACLWSGRLILPNTPNGSREYAGDNSGVEKLLRALNEQYRAEFVTDRPAPESEGSK